MRKNKKEQMYFQMLCASNNLFRAMENKDYKAAFDFLAKRKVLDAGKCRKWTYIGYSLWEAKIYAGLGDEKSARLNAEYVLAEGGRLVYVERAKALLREMGSAEKEKFANAKSPDGESESAGVSNG